MVVSAKRTLNIKGVHNWLLQLDVAASSVDCTFSVKM